MYGGINKYIHKCSNYDQNDMPRILATYVPHCTVAELLFFVLFYFFVAAFLSSTSFFFPSFSLPHFCLLTLFFAHLKLAEQIQWNSLLSHFKYQMMLQCTRKHKKLAQPKSTEVLSFLRGNACRM